MSASYTKTITDLTKKKKKKKKKRKRKKDTSLSFLVSVLFCILFFVFCICVLSFREYIFHCSSPLVLSLHQLLVFFPLAKVFPVRLRSRAMYCSNTNFSCFRMWIKFDEHERFWIGYSTSGFVPCGKCRKFGSPYLGKAQQPQEQRYPFPSVCAVFPSVQTMLWLPVFGICNVRTDADACDCTRGGCTDTVRESALEADSGRKIPFAVPGTDSNQR